MLRALFRRPLVLAALALALGLAFSGRPKNTAPVARPGFLLAPLRLEGRILLDDGARPANRRHIYVLGMVTAQCLDPPGRPFAWPGRVRASLDLEAAEAQGLLPGDRVEAYGNLRGVYPPTNPGEFNYRAYLAGRGIHAGFSARQGWPLRRLEQGSGWQPRRWATQAQAWLARGLGAGLDGRSLSLARGIVLGDKSLLAPEDLSDYSRSGFADLLAVSGTHFTLALGLFLLLAKRFTFSKRWQAAAGLALGLIYAFVTGFEAPVQRAFALFMVWLMGRLFDLDSDLPTSLAFGALLILAVQPGALWEAGFQLSFMVTAAVVGLGPALAERLPAGWPRWLRLGAGAVIAAQTALLPLLAYHFHQFCWPALFATLLSGAFTFCILALGLPLSLAGGRLPFAAEILGRPLDWVLRALDGLTQFSAGLPHSAYSTGLVPLWLLGLFLAWALAAMFKPARWLWVLLPPLFALLLLPGMAWRHRHPGETRFWCLDIGQGDSLLLEFGDGRTLLVDGGKQKPDAGAWVVVPALRALGIQGLTWALATHADADHAGGLVWVLDQMPVKELLWNGQVNPSQVWAAVDAKAREKGVPLRALGTAIPRRAADGPWQVLNPSPPLRRRRRPPKLPDTNGASVVLRVEDWLLLTGDLPIKGEKRLLGRGLESVAVLKVGHHGSRTSSSPAFVRALRPALSLISCGRDNSYGHPHAKALKALKGTELYRTDQQGCLALRHWADGRLEILPWQESPAALRWRPRPRPVSAWSGLKAAQQEAWSGAGEDGL
jgi:competence protein ComEC